MTAALLLTIGIARKLRGNCAISDGGVLANDGSSHADCSTCHALCGKPDEMGLADAGFNLVRTLTGLQLKWLCPGCGTKVSEETELFDASSKAKIIACDALCIRCRNTNKEAP